MTKLITTKEELDEAFPNIKTDFDKPVAECGSEDACELKEVLLENEVIEDYKDAFTEELFENRRDGLLYFLNQDKCSMFIEERRLKIIQLEEYIIQAKMKILDTEERLDVLYKEIIQAIPIQEEFLLKLKDKIGNGNTKEE